MSDLPVSIWIARLLSPLYMTRSILSFSRKVKPLLIQVMFFDLLDIIPMLESATALVGCFSPKRLRSLRRQLIKTLAVNRQGDDQSHGGQFLYGPVPIGDLEPQVLEAFHKPSEGFELDILQDDPAQGG